MGQRKISFVSFDLKCVGFISSDVKILALNPYERLASFFSLH